MECFIYQSVNFENNSVLDFEPIQRMENRWYMAELMSFALTVTVSCICHQQ